MKKRTILGSFMVMALGISLTLPNGKNSELSGIETTLNHYLIGGTENDAERVVSAFHPSAMMKFVQEGAFTEVNAAERFGGIKPGPRQDRQTQIVSVDITNEVAVAKVRIDYPTFSFVDYMTLLKLDGEWKIVNKAFTRELKE